MRGFNIPFEFEELEIPDVILIKPKIFRDGRGFFIEVYKKPDFMKIVLKVSLLKITTFLRKVY